MTLRQDQLRPASFRGVPFQVDAADLEAGRRTQLHEYPQRDKPFSEDLGRATRTLSVTAFVVGDDYLQQAERLLAALETPGPGTLVHPWHGTLQVTVGIARVTFSTRELGVARFEIPCVEAGELTFPSVQASTQAQSRIAADGLAQAAADEFAGTFRAQGWPDFVVDGALADINSAIGVLSVPVPGLEALGYAERLSNALPQIVASMSQPSKLAGLLSTALGLAGVAAAGTRWASVVQSLARLAASVRLADPPPPAVVTSSRLQANRNTKAINVLIRRTLLAQAVGSSSVMPPTVYDDVVAVRDVLTASLDAEALTAGDRVFVALQAARAGAWKDLTERARGSARLRSHTPPAPLPALAVAYALYGDAGRAYEIVTRNKIRHPGFLPALPLQVLMQ